ncbi:hypothetical protein EHW99_1954 [Erwinia amylovora]|uniref:Uncharacterized protein n=2 Tax=Erwinia amylovora TaxID=552 RepID=A0A831ESA3_ERWAM|nr:hypothetical protein EaACW_1634 [Erwinia amylovora ACW56400]QJQ54658.1 hypothetical protein EHX00_1954 [Erwinia amylovora]CBA20577.1 hypothetical protein predicted by Glimmer/Critica [Erwinia amylovora CFBP1430]CCO78481.1 hypothetical protein BN432_1678 [Erwinia amylovora Ea356]CCO82275.1 hypothetical protein BN433_1700 [Erwinia amylovora Ea266]CCO86063.1 hypothetical protein BN434_1670 [Erwinia amylovora CFBP 2585]CCO89853.1 hypothetical protein BN435_1677 [Erwinia amylovora 01SFR-BO]CCO
MQKDLVQFFLPERNKFLLKTDVDMELAEITAIK